MKVRLVEIMNDAYAKQVPPRFSVRELIFIFASEIDRVLCVHEHRFGFVKGRGMVCFLCDIDRPKEAQS